MIPRSERRGNWRSCWKRGPCIFMGTRKESRRLLRKTWRSFPWRIKELDVMRAQDLVFREVLARSRP